MIINDNPWQPTSALTGAVPQHTTPPNFFQPVSTPNRCVLRVQQCALLVMQVPSTHFLAPPFWNMGNSSPTFSLRACCGLTSWVSDSGVATLCRCQFPKGLVQPGSKGRNDGHDMPLRFKGQEIVENHFKFWMAVGCRWLNHSFHTVLVFPLFTTHASGNTSWICRTWEHSSRLGTEGPWR